MTPTTMAPPRLRPEHARDLAAADAKVHRAKRAFEKAKADRQELINRHRARLPLGEWIRAAGKVIRLTRPTSGRSFSLTGYLEHHTLTPEMEPFVGEGREYDRLDVKDA
jgi:hypothetical protein